MNALRALAPRPRSPVPRPSRPQPHAVPPLEPTGTATLASGRADRARAAVSGMLGVRTAAVKPQMTRRAQHDGSPSRPSRIRSGHDAARLGRRGAATWL
jgi:hypothetical protein